MLYNLLAATSRIIGIITAPCGTGDAKDTCDTGLPNVAAGSDQIHQILTIVFATTAALSVMMIVIAGFRMITADTNPQEVAKARHTIIYALIGLFVSLGAEAIVSFVIGRL